LQNEKLQKELERKKLQAMMSDGKDEVKKEDDGCGWGMGKITIIDSYILRRYLVFLIGVFYC